VSDAAAPRSFGELLLSRAQRRGADRAYRFIGASADDSFDLSYSELVARAQRVAASLAQHVGTGDRVLLLCSVGEPYVTAFHACQLLGAIAVPAYPPRGNRHAARISRIVHDCEPGCIVTDRENLASLTAALAGDDASNAAPPKTPILAVEDLLAGTQRFEGTPAVDPSQPAFLQYTSGSTGTPKGVMVSHANIFANLQGISRKFEVDASYRTVFWLPPYHDMGLVGGILHPVFGGYPVALMSPFLFVQSPIRWLRLIAQEQATASAAPNFGYQSCIDRVSAEQCEGLDLSCWKIAICGGERVSARTMRAFAQKFAPHGFDAAALYPTYGMAEATLLMTGGRKGGGFRAVERLQTTGGEAEGYTDVVSCGQAMDGHALHVVAGDPPRLAADGEVGEIWYAGPSVAAGYWRRPADDFSAEVPGADGRFLRTGDLGTRTAGEVYILGRTKEMIIVRGANFYPTDLEEAVAGAHPAIEGGAVAAFAAQRDGVEGVVLALEIRREMRKTPLDDIRKASTRALVEAFDIRPLDVVVLRPSGMLRTSSGKIRRTEMAAGYRAGDLLAWPADETDTPPA
jgi:acyl-CoA synthetase (AMP-forming)/AMP-acid ligase II